MWISAELLTQEAARFGVCLDETQVMRFDALARELVRFNEHVNVTAIVQPDDIVKKHFGDSLAVFTAGIDLTNANAIDIGAGAGFPSLPLLIASDTIRITMVDSVEKKLKFAANMIDLLGLDGQTIAARAETLASLPDHRETYDLALSRAVARWRIIDELTLPFVKVGGCSVLYKGNISDEERAEGTDAQKVFGVSGRFVPYEIDEEPRMLIVSEKTRKMPDCYPRPYAKIKNKPPIAW